MQTVEYGGWKRNVRLTNGEIEVIVTQDVGPRAIRFGFVGGLNVFAEIKAQLGGTGEKEWLLRGGHRLWVAPEESPKTYELDNEAVAVEPIPNGIRTVQAAGPLSGIAKSIEITVSRNANEVVLLHILRNAGAKPADLAPWALSVMAPGGMAVIPLPKKIPHTERLTHNQVWSIWAYTDFGDPRWTLGSRYVFFRQDPNRGPNKLGIAQREGWVGYLLGDLLFVKRFGWIDGATYPDGGVNFETFSNQDFLEMESLGPMVTLAPGESVTHAEKWSLFRGVPASMTEADIDRNVLPLIAGR